MPRSILRLLLVLLLSSLAPAAAHAQAPAGTFPDAWYYYGGRSEPMRHLRELEGRPAPELRLKDWIGEAQRLADLRGKIVVVDFWATWCSPCVRAIPKNVQMARKYKDNLVIIGVHDANRGAGNMAAVAGRNDVNYPIAVDDGGASARAWRVTFWPTYILIDREGIVRGAGLRPEHVESAVAQMLAPGTAAPTPGPAAPEPDATRPGAPGPGAGDAILPSWGEGNEARRRSLGRIENGPAPGMISEQWLNSAALSLEELRGKVVLLDFWATWCAPCLASIPRMNDLHEKYAKEGLVVVGVCHPNKVERMGEVVTQRGIRYAVCADRSGKIVNDYKVDSYPDYYLIDRAGRLRIADCRSDALEAAIKLLLAE